MHHLEDANERGDMKKGEKYVILTLGYTREDDNWVGICHELSTSTFADTLEQCQRELAALVVEHLDVLEETGQRERFFQEWGIELCSINTSPKEFILRGDSVPEWNDLFQGILQPNSGPLLQPRAFPIYQAKGKDKQAVLHDG